MVTEISLTSQEFIKLAAPGVQRLQPYQPGKSISELERELGISDIIKLASNENPLGPSPRVLEVIRNELPELSRYPDGGGIGLKTALAKKIGISIDQITLSNGSSELLDLIARVFLSSASESVFSEHAFAMYPLVTQAVGASARIAPCANGTSGVRYGHDLEAMAQLVTNKTSVVFIANPNNPTGTYTNCNDLDELIRSLPAQVVCVIDEAYFEYVDKSDYPNTIACLDTYPNLIVTRTFSKAYGLAGLRIGYAISNKEIADLLNRIRQPFNVNSLALVAAEAALADNDHLVRSKAANHSGLNQLKEGIQSIGLEAIPSVANFICIDLKQEAEPIYRALLKKGVIVRPVANYDLPNHIRVTVGTEKENTLFLNALDSVLIND